MPDWFVRNVSDNDWWVEREVRRPHMLVPEGSRSASVSTSSSPESRPDHRQSEQEGFLVIEGECLLIVDGEERLLRPWDYFHCAPGTTHGFVGAGDAHV